ncbi:MAG: right-handed parallel beta-helix repeat-containing protein [Sedimentisphaerales bacterium]|nr:right-handed parallel beta-helix repeat-containing protein [Sedimentisphaerales bacterium]
MKTVIRLFLLFLCCSGFGFSQGNPTELYVDVDGNDAWSGALPGPNAARTDGPLVTLTAARDKIRKQEIKEVVMSVRGGDYFLTEPLVLTSQDAASKILIRPWNEEKVRLIAGREVKGFTSVRDSDILKRLDPEARKNVLQADLKAQGITDFGEIKNRGFGRPTYPAALEVFFQDRPMTLARWPNEGWIKIDKVPAGQEGGKFTYKEDRPDRWTQTEDIWMHGFWTQDWADSYEHIKSIDTATKTIETVPPHGVYGYTPDHRFYFLNVLEELDNPGEWYLDRKTGILYFWPPAPISSHRVFVSTIDSAFSIENCSDVTIQGFTIECTRGTAVSLKNCQDVRIADCTIRDIGNAGVRISGGRRNGVSGCDIYETGDGGIGLSGGDTAHLIPAGNYAENNHVHHYSRWCMTYRPAVGVGGVGQRVSHNLIHDGPHNAIQLGGNDHIIEYNEIHDVCTESDDVGAFYSGRSWADRGTIIRYNFFHHIHSAAEQYRHGSRVVYLDDAASGFTIHGNVFYKAGSLCAVNIGGGRDNIVTNNIFIDCKHGVLMDARGVKWAKQYISSGGGWHMYEKIKAVNYDQPPYSTRYPKLATILAEEPAEPRGNMVSHNLAVRTNLLNTPDGYRNLVEMEGNFSTDQDPGFINETGMDFRLKKDSVALKEMSSFTSIPFDKIGLQRK